MTDKARRWLAVAGGSAATLAGVIALTNASASAEPLPPPPPAPATVTQTVVVSPYASPPQALPGPAPVAQPALVPATSGTLTEYFAGKRVALEPQVAQNFTALSITMPMPPGWSQVPNPNVPDAFMVLADRVGGDGLYSSNAQLIVYKLIGEFDPREAITHGYVDSQKLLGWRTTAASLQDFGGAPSSLTEGVFRENDMTLNTSRRHVIATAGSDRYLVSLSVTTSVSQAVATASATDAIVNGFRVASAVAPAAAPAVARPAP